MIFGKILDFIMLTLGPYSITGDGPDSARTKRQKDRQYLYTQISINSSHAIHPGGDSPSGGGSPVQEAELSRKNPRTTRCREGSTSGGGYDDGRDLKIKDLEDKLEKSRKKCNDFIRQANKMWKERDGALKKREEMRKERDIARKERDEPRKDYKKEYKDLQSELQKSDGIYRNNYRLWKKQQDALKMDYEAAQALIAELTVEISHSVKANGTTTRDDNYFELQFASLEGAIRQWVFRSFRGASGMKHQDLPQIAQDSLKASVFRYSAPPDTKVNLKEIEAIVIERLCAHVFHPSFLIRQEYLCLDSISKALGGTDLEKREWQAQTVGRILGREDYNDILRDNIHFVEKDLRDYFSILPRGGGGEQRLKSLLAIVEQAAKLQMEVFPQISPFELPRVNPGDRYNPHLMDDISGLADEEAEGGSQNLIVRIVLFPPVLRLEFGEDGKLLERSSAVVVRRGVVVVMRLEDEHMRV